MTRRLSLFILTFTILLAFPQRGLAARDFLPGTLVDDTTPPTITELTINFGAVTTTDTHILLRISAEDGSDGSGVQQMLIIERVYNASSHQWVPVKNTGWVNYQPSWSLAITEQGGEHILQVWVTDGAGNISATSAQASIFYLPTQDSLQANETRVYRLTLTAGTPQHILLTTLSGDADLYVWDPDGNQVGFSSNEGVTTDEVNFTPGKSGTYQVEVYGYLASTYTIDLGIQVSDISWTFLPMITN